MNDLDVDELVSYINKNIVEFHESKIRLISNLKLQDLLKKKNPYLFKVKNLHKVQDLIINLLDAVLYASEEGIFGNFLEDLAIFISSKTHGGRKSSSQGIDLEFEFDGIYYLMSIKSGSQWGNASQHSKQEQDFKNAKKVLMQSKHVTHVLSVLGICYGKTRTSYLASRGWWKVVGQNFWTLISGKENIYKEIIEPLGYEAKKHTEAYEIQKDSVINLFTQEFLEEFCDNGHINWQKLVEFNSGNLDLSKFPSLRF